MNSIEQKIGEFEKRNQEIKKKLETWSTVSLFCEERYNPFDTEFFENMISLVILGVILFLNYQVFNFIGFSASIGFDLLKLFVLSLIVYFVLFVPFGIYANKKYNYYSELYKNFNDEVNIAIDDYYNEKCAEAGIQDGFLYFNNGLAVGGMGSIVYAKLPTNYGRMKFYFRDNFCDKEHLKYKTEGLLKDNPGKYFLNENIASLEFNHHFWVLADSKTKHESLAYLSPATQLNLLKKCISYEFTGFIDLREDRDTKKLFEIYDDQLIVNLDYKIAEGGHLHVDLPDYSEFANKDIRHTFEMVDKYCETFPPVALEIATIFDEKIGFLRGNAYC